MSKTNELPKGWTSTTVGEIAKAIQYGHTASATDDPDGPRFLRITDIQNGQVAWEMVPSCEISPDEASKYRLDSGDIVFARTGATTGKSFLIKQCPDAVFASYLIRLRMFQCIYASFVQAYFQTNDYWRQIEGGKRGIGQPNVNANVLGKITLPLAPSNEQLRIVAKIEELFSDLDAGVAALERIRANLKRYRAAVLKAAVEGKLTEEWRAKHPKTEPASKLLERILAERRRKWEEDQLAKFAAADKTPSKGWREKYIKPTTPDTSRLPQLPQGWCWANVEQVNSAARPISYGVLQPGDDLNSGIPLVRVCDIADGRVAIDQLKQIAPSISEQYRRTILQGGEVLLTVVGTIGRTAVAPVELAGANTARAVAVIAVVAPHNPNFLELTLRESSMRAKLTLAAHEVARKTLNLEDVRVAVVPIAPQEEQTEILKLVAEKLSQIEAAEASIEQNMKRAARLRQSTLKRAFEGRLVPQDPTDEPAEKLLERLRAARLVHVGYGKVEVQTRRGRRARPSSLDGRTDK